MEKNIVCFGDSNTHGYQTANDGRFTRTERFTCLLEGYLGEGYYVLEEGLSGRTTSFDDPLFEGLNGCRAIAQCLLTHEPIDLLIIMLGTNDAKQRFSANAYNITRGLERLIEKAISVTDAWRNRANILIIAPPPIEEAYNAASAFGEMGEGCALKSRMLSGLYQEAAKRLGCHFLDAGSIAGIKMHPLDCMHFDKESHMLLALKLAEIIPDII